MLKTILTSLRSPELRKKLLFTAFILLVYRFGSFVPTPGIDLDALQAALDQRGSRLLDFLNLFAGGALTRFAVFALGIMPYITASIILQLMTVVIPSLEKLQKEGESGQQKITQYTRYFTVVLALLQSMAYVLYFRSQDALPGFTPGRFYLIVLSVTAGTVLLMWLGELITQRGIGNGMSILIFASVVSSLPSQLGNVYTQGDKLQFFVIIGIAIAMIVGIVAVESGQRRIPVQFAKRVVGRRMYGGQNTYIPLKVNQSGVIPVIFASSILQFPALLTSVVPWDWYDEFVNENLLGTGATTWTYIGLYALMILFFAYFYTAIAFNPQQQADIIRRQGGFIPGIRPGPPTERYLAKVLNRITLPGALFLMVIALVPFVVFKVWDISQFPFGGTSLLITVGVALETMKQIDSQLMMRNYEGFLR
jgi:preprotein translocase subunit SecY